MGIIKDVCDLPVGLKRRVETSEQGVDIARWMADGNLYESFSCRVAR